MRNYGHFQQANHFSCLGPWAVDQRAGNNLKAYSVPGEKPLNFVSHDVWIWAFVNVFYTFMKSHFVGTGHQVFTTISSRTSWVQLMPVHDWGWCRPHNDTLNCVSEYIRIQFHCSRQSSWALTPNKYFYKEVVLAYIFRFSSRHCKSGVSDNFDHYLSVKTL